MSDWKFLNAHRVGPNTPVGSTFIPKMYHGTDADGFNGMFRFAIDGRFLRIIASDGEGWQHVSVSEEGKTKPVDWSTMCKVKDLFWEPNDWVAQFHPAQSEYVNQHPGVLHLWRCTDRDFPTPDRILVGVKTDADARRVNNDPRSPVYFLR